MQTNEEILNILFLNSVDKLNLKILAKKNFT